MMELKIDVVRLRVDAKSQAARRPWLIAQWRRFYEVAAIRRGQQSCHGTMSTCT
jgi:hypothetical protein